MRSNTVFVLSLTLFGEVIQFSALTTLIPPTVPGTIENIRDFLFVYVALGIIAFAYWLIHRPDYAIMDQKPLGIALLVLQNAVLGLVLVIEGILLLFLPVLGIIGVASAGIGIGLFKLAKGLFDGEFWALEIMFVLTVIGIISGIVIGFVVSPYGFGIPLPSLFQLWYLRRPNVSKFFETHSG